MFLILFVLSLLIPWLVPFLSRFWAFLFLFLAGSSSHWFPVWFSCVCVCVPFLQVFRVPIFWICCVSHVCQIFKTLRVRKDCAQLVQDTTKKYYKATLALQTSMSLVYFPLTFPCSYFVSLFLVFAWYLLPFSFCLGLFLFFSFHFTISFLVFPSCVFLFLFLFLSIFLSCCLSFSSSFWFVFLSVCIVYVFLSLCIHVCALFFLPFTFIFMFVFPFFSYFHFPFFWWSLLSNACPFLLTSSFLFNFLSFHSCPQCIAKGSCMFSSSWGQGIEWCRCLGCGCASQIQC